MIDFLKLASKYKSESYDWLNAYFLFNDYVCVTDTFSSIMIPKSKISESLTFGDNAPNFGNIFNLINNDSAFCPNFTLGDLDTMTNQIPHIEEYGVCLTCNGHATIECHCCGNERDCHNCDGTGVNPNILQNVIDYTYHVQILGYNINLTKVRAFVERFLECGFSPDTKVKVVSNNYDSPIVLMIDDIYVAMMITKPHYVNNNKIVKML